MTKFDILKRHSDKILPPSETSGSPWFPNLDVLKCFKVSSAVSDRQSSTK